MACLIFCNVCFQKPRGTALNFSLTNCGHVICGQCLQKGNLPQGWQDLVACC